MATETKNLKKLTKNLGKYLDQDQLEQVKKAYFFAANAHSGQFRVSGDPYVFRHCENHFLKAFSL